MAATVGKIVAGSNYSTALLAASLLSVPFHFRLSTENVGELHGEFPRVGGFCVKPIQPGDLVAGEVRQGGWQVKQEPAS